MSQQLGFEQQEEEGGEITNSLGNIYSQDVPTGCPGTSLYDVLHSLFDYFN